MVCDIYIWIQFPKVCQYVPFVFRSFKKCMKNFAQFTKNWICLQFVALQNRRQIIWEFCNGTFCHNVSDILFLTLIWEKHYKSCKIAKRQFKNHNFEYYTWSQKFDIIWKKCAMQNVYYFFSFFLNQII